MTKHSLLLLPLLLALGCQSAATSTEEASPSEPTKTEEAAGPSTTEAPESQPSSNKGQPEADPVPQGMSVATFAGGCFWCMEGPFEKIDGVSAVLSGYTGGPEKNPTYKLVSSGKTGHTEAVRVIYDPGKVEYKTLVETFWRSMDPTDAGGQFADRGPHYRPAIFFHTSEQETIAKESKQALEASKKFDKPIVVPIQPAETFWVAEDNHQDYYKTNSVHYNMYKKGSGRAGFLEKYWGE